MTGVFFVLIIHYFEMTNYSTLSCGSEELPNAAATDDDGTTLSMLCAGFSCKCMTQRFQGFLFGRESCG